VVVNQKCLYIHEIDCIKAAILRGIEVVTLVAQLCIGNVKLLLSAKYNDMGFICYRAHIKIEVEEAKIKLETHQGTT